jgi:glycosyltransferase involved in cell wall biosynthesis
MPAQEPSVAYIIPTYNRWPRVCRAIDSVLSADATAIVVDDASTDGTAEQLAAAYGPRLTLLRQPANREKSAARNAGLAAATTELVGFLDSDDAVLPAGVAALRGVFRDDPAFAGVAYGACQAGDTVEIPAAALPAGQVLSAYVRQPFLHTPAFLIRRQTLLTLGAYREELTNLEDVELFVRLMARLEFRNCGAVVARFDRLQLASPAQLGLYGD